MQCGYPISLNGGKNVPCGRCIPCRINTRRMWTGRILLEAQYSRNRSAFITLTFSEENKTDNQVHPEELQWYVKAIRNRFRDETIRFFGVGEYGDKFGRAHYHLAVFNKDPGENEEAFKECWPNGHVHIGEIETGSARYLASYTVKKLTKSGDARLDGRNPEFSRMSKFPPIGSAGVEHIQTLLETRTGAAAIANQGDVPTSFKIGKTHYPLGRYWRAKLREWNGVDNPTLVDWELTEDEQKKAEQQAAKLWSVKNRSWYNRKIL